MPNLDPVTNFAKVTVSTTYGAADTSIVLSAGEGAKLPAPATDGSFNLVWWNWTDYKDPADDPNKEIVRVTARSTDTLTVTRAQEGTSASTKNTASKTYKMALAPTKKLRDDLESLLKANLASGVGTDLAVKVYHEDFAENSTGRFTIGGSATYVNSNAMGFISMTTVDDGVANSNEWYADTAIRPGLLITPTIVLEFLINTSDGVPAGNFIDFSVGAGPTAGQYPGFENNSFGFGYNGSAGGGGTWFFKTRDGATTQSDTGLTALSAGMHRIRFEITGSGATYKCFVDGVQVGTTHTTNVPGSTTIMNPRVILGDLTGDDRGSAVYLLQVRAVMG